MSEKRFTTDYSDFIQNDKTFIKRGNERLTYKEIVDLLNEQLSIIRRDEMSIKTMMSNMEKLEKENEQLRQKLETLDLNEKNDAVKMIDGKVFIRM